MTSTADMTQHPDVSEISDLTEGLLSPSRSADLRRHLDGCALCADVLASLEEIRGLLGTLPGSTRMPVDIAERIDAALAAEALLDSTAPDDRADVSRETAPVVPRQEPKPASRPAGHARGTTGPGRSGRGRRRLSIVGGVAALAALGVLLFQTLDLTGGDQQNTARDGSAHAEAGAYSGDFSSPGLDEHVRALLSGDTSEQQHGATESDKTFGTRESGPAPRLKSARTAPPCIQRGTGQSDTPIEVEQGQYRGESAYLVVFADPADRQRVLAYVIDATCVESATTSPGKLLLKDSYARS
ncbi:anti-sigma factor family protein [Streptomyces sp. NPDC001889]